MASFFAKKVTKHVLKENAENKFGTDDPYFEHVAAVDLNGHPTGKYQKRKRAVPPGLTKQEEKVLKKVTRRAYRLDNCLNICGIRVGWSAIVGLIPAAGDIIDALMAFMVVFTATKADIPSSLKSRMIINIGLDFAVGLVPFLGDIADAFFRCNTRNAALLWKYLEERGATRLEQRQNPNSSSDAKVNNVLTVDTRTSEIPQSIELQNSRKDTHRGSNRGKTHSHGKESAPNLQLSSTTRKGDDHDSNRRAPNSRYVTADDLPRKPKKARLARENAASKITMNKNHVDSLDVDLENGDRLGRINKRH